MARPSCGATACSSAVIALEAVGGWSPTALTEDLELSTRLTAARRARGARAGGDGEEQAVESVGALWRQRMRWAEGSLRRLMELGPIAGGQSRVAARPAAGLHRLHRRVRDPAALRRVDRRQPPDGGAAAARRLDGPDHACSSATALGTYLLALAGLAASGERSLRILGRSLRGSLVPQPLAADGPGRTAAHRALAANHRLRPDRPDGSMVGPMSPPRASLVVIGQVVVAAEADRPGDCRGDRHCRWAGGQRRHAGRGGGIRADRGDAGRSRTAGGDARAARLPPAPGRHGTRSARGGAGRGR